MKFGRSDIGPKVISWNCVERVLLRRLLHVVQQHFFTVAVSLAVNADVGADTVLTPFFIEFVLRLSRGAAVHLRTEFFEGAKLALEFSVYLGRCQDSLTSGSIVQLSSSCVVRLTRGSALILS